jgi:hypothetical protein
MHISEWIEKLECDRSLSLEQFYVRLKGALSEIEERLSMAEHDGIDLEMIDDDNDGDDY